MHGLTTRSIAGHLRLRQGIQVLKNAPQADRQRLLPEIMAEIKRTKNIALYRELMMEEGTGGCMVLEDVVWEDETERWHRETVRRLERALKEYKSNLIKESIRVRQTGLKQTLHHRCRKGACATDTNETMSCMVASRWAIKNWPIITINVACWKRLGKGIVKCVTIAPRPSTLLIRVGTWSRCEPIEWRAHRIIGWRMERIDGVVYVY